MNVLNDTDITLAVIITTLIILLLIAAVVIVIFLAGRHRSQTRLIYEKELRTAGQEIQEQVLSHISSELHDNIGQLLTLMRMQLEKEKLKHPETIPLLAPADQTLTHIVQQVRQLSHSLNSDLLERQGLAEAIRLETARLQQLGHIVLHYQYDGQELALENDQQLIVFRIFQELTNNALKHAGAANLFITLSGSDRFLLTVKDDGKGFDMDRLPATGAGIRNISRRAGLAGLNCTLSSIPGQGTTCTIESI